MTILQLYIISFMCLKKFYPETGPLGLKRGTIINAVDSIVADGCYSFILQLTQCDDGPRKKDAFIYEMC